MIDTARKHGAGVFVLALTSNPEGAEVQHARTEDGATVGGPDARPPARAQRRGGAAGLVRRRVGATIGEHRRSSTSPSTARCWRPGIGAQGGTAADMRRIFGAAARPSPELVA